VTRRRLGDQEVSDLTIRTALLKAREDAFDACMVEHVDVPLRSSCIRGVQRAITNFERNLKIRLLGRIPTKRR